MLSYGPIVVAPTSDPQNLKLTTNINKILFINGSPYTLTINAADGKNPAKKIMPLDRDVVELGDQWSGSLTWTASADITNAAQSPAFIMYVETFGPREQVTGVYPASLPWLMSIGNSVPLSATATAISNEGNPIGTLVYDAGPAGNLNIVEFWNDHFIWSVVQSGVAHQVLKGQTSGNPLQIGQSGDNTEVLGNMVVDGSSIVNASGSFFWWSALLSGADKILFRMFPTDVGEKDWRIAYSSANHAPYLSDATDSTMPWVALPDGSLLLGNQNAKFDANGHLIQSAPLGGSTQDFLDIAPSDRTLAWAFQDDTSDNLFIGNPGGQEVLRLIPAGSSGIKISGVGGVVRAWSHFTGNATGTYSHGLGTTPNVVLLNASAVGSETLGWDSATSTTVHITNGAAIAWTAMALLMA